MGFLASVKKLFRLRTPAPVLGLALGSGGAKGMAHLGALKAFAEAGLSFRVVTGTSIGSIVGALYCKGYTWADMTGIVDNLNKKEFAKNLRPFSDMQPIEEFLENFLEGEIEALPLPFAAWATDAETNEGVRLDHGKTARALTASAAIPPFFRGVEIEGRRLYDGAYTNAIPADVCRDLGADVVVAVDVLGRCRETEKVPHVLSLIARVYDIMDDARTQTERRRTRRITDLWLEPEMGDLSQYKVRYYDEAYEAGYRIGKENAEKIRALIAE